jgi:NAD(P)-dependent dehydrogenase (short-subunit alcohol dehydrogenase family)
MNNYNPFSLENKTVLVTGASSGIGRATAIECSRMGATLVITGRNAERLQETFDLLEGTGHLRMVADLTDEAQVSSLVAELPRLNGIVHNAGIGGDRTPCKMIRREKLDLVMGTNFTAPVLLQTALMQAKKIECEASIVFMASRAPFAPVRGNALYTAAKAGLLGYAKVLGLEVAPQKIRVNCICPAMVLTELAIRDFELVGADYRQDELLYPLKRYGKPEEIAYLAIYLLSDASVWMTGSRIDITGGVNLR